MKRNVTEATAVERLESLCVAAERCESELRRKLWLWGIDAVTADKIMERLREARFVDDARFARSFVRDKYRLARWGRRKIVSALVEKHVDYGFIKDALAEIEEDLYVANVYEVVAAKMRSMPDARSFEGRTKLFRYAVGRGYEPSLVADVIKNPRLWADGEC